MTATATVPQVSQHAVIQEKEWVKLFPEQVTENYTSSLTFIKQLTIVAVSTITYLKNAFPEDSYYSESFGGLKLKLLKSRCCDELAQFVSTAVQQAFEAFDKKYIQQLALCFYDGDCKPENLIEYHVFEYSYTAEGAALSINSKNRNSARHALKCSMESVKARTTMLVRSLSLFVWQNCQQELPLNYDISLRLYYNEDAPEGYQAPGFQSTDDLDHLRATAAEAVLLGWVETPYHKLVARTFVRDQCDSDAAAPSDNQPEITQANNEDFPDDGTCSSASLREPRLRCPCGKADAHDQPLLTCQYCQMKQHQACFGFLTPVEVHCCESCADQDSSRKPSDRLLVGLERRKREVRHMRHWQQHQASVYWHWFRKPSDRLLVSLERRKRECLCIFRRTLELCSRATSVSGRALMDRFQLSASSASKMLRLLQSHYILPAAADDDLTAARKINHLRLKLTLKRFFETDEHSLVERLVAETAQVSIDPVADVLTPEQKLSLMHTGTLGTVVDSPELTPASNDPTLQEYREAILSAEDVTEELPLSGSHNPVPHAARIGKRPLKRKGDDEEWQPNKLPKLRSGAKTKRRA